MKKGLIGESLFTSASQVVRLKHRSLISRVRKISQPAPKFNLEKVGESANQERLGSWITNLWCLLCIHTVPARREKTECFEDIVLVWEYVNSGMSKKMTQWSGWDPIKTVVFIYLFNFCLFVLSCISIADMCFLFYSLLPGAVLVARSRWRVLFCSRKQHN